MAHDHAQPQAGGAAPAAETQSASGRNLLAAGQVRRAIARRSIQRKNEASSNGVAQGAGAAIQRAAQGAGSALPPSLQQKFEGSLGADLSGVRVHTGGDSEGAAESVGAKAYTVGQDIHFGKGQFEPGSKEGQRLLAHEVAHTVQQSSAGAAHTQCKLDVSTPGDGAEVEADHAADAMLDGQAAAVGAAEPAIQRAVVTNGGTFDTTNYVTAGAAGGLVGCDIDIKFTANDLVEADQIGLTQTNTRLASPAAGGAPSDPAPGVVGQPILAGRANSAAEADPGRLIDRVEHTPDPATGNDTSLPVTNPMYGVHNTPANAATGAAAQVSTSLGDTPPGGNATFGSHTKQADGTFNPPVDATLHDAPRVSQDQPNQEWTDRFETTALVMSGPMANTYLGSVNWGYKVGADGSPVLDPASLTIAQAGAPTAAFMTAAQHWNDQALVDPTTGINYSTVDLPITTSESGNVAATDMTTQQILARLAQVNAALGGALPAAEQTNKEFEKRALETELQGRGISMQIRVQPAHPAPTGSGNLSATLRTGGRTVSTAPMPLTGAEQDLNVAQALAPLLPLAGPIEIEINSGEQVMLRRGSQGDMVKRLQTMLNEQGADPPLAVDGIFGPKTQAAVRHYQEQNGLSEDGIVGPLTWGALGGGNVAGVPTVDTLIWNGPYDPMDQTNARPDAQYSTHVQFER